MFEFTILAHFMRYPAMQPADVYKLIHQAAMGSEHAVSDARSARRWLERELVEMGNGPNEPVIDPLSEETGIARVHLRPYIVAGGDSAKLLDAFLTTANQHRGDKNLLQTYWGAALNLTESRQLPFSLRQMQEFFTPLKEQNFPALHHTLEYERLYRPAYRVILKSFLG